MSRKYVVYAVAAIIALLAAGYFLFVQSRVRAVERACTTLSVGMPMSEAKKWIAEDFLPIAFGFPRTKDDPYAELSSGDFLVLAAKTPLALHTCGLTFRDDRIASVTRGTLTRP